MKITILGGASFVGYWVKEGIRERFPKSRFQIIDSIRERIFLVKRYKDIFISTDLLTRNILLEFSPELIVINLYDLLSYSSLTFSVNNNNLLIDSINQLMDVAKELKCPIILIQNKNIYSEETISQQNGNSYYQTFNIYNSFYYEYITTFSKAYNTSLKVFLLPNTFGLYESRESVVSSITDKIIKGKCIELSSAKRDFIYIKKVVPVIVNRVLETNNSVISLTSGRLIEIKRLYEIISSELKRESEIEDFEDKVILKELVKTDQTNVEEIPIDITCDLSHCLKVQFNIDRKASGYFKRKLLD